MKGFPHCEICARRVESGEKAVELYTGTARSKGILRNLMGNFLRINSVSLAVAHAECVYPDKEKINTEEMARDLLFDARGLTLEVKEH